MISTLT